MSEVYNNLAKLLDEKNIEYHRDYRLSSLSPLKVGGSVRMLVYVKSEYELKTLINFVSENKIKYFVLGEARNLLLSEKGFDGVAIKLTGDFYHYRIEGHRLIAGGALPMERAAREARIAALGGLEFAGSLPGSVGGCVRHNVKSFGEALSDILASVTVLNKDGEIEEVSSESIIFGKTDSTLANMIILEAVFALDPEPEYDIDQRTDRYRYIRGMLQPASASTGLIFREHGENKAHLMIERIGALSLNYNGAKLYKKFPNYVVVEEEPTADDVYKLIMETRKRIFQHFNINLDINIVFLGDFEE